MSAGPTGDALAAEDVSYGEAYKWQAAVSQYLDGYPVPLAAMLRDPESKVVSDNARALLADLVDGKDMRSKGGRPEERSGRSERAMVSDFFAEWERQESASLAQRNGARPKSAALEVVADRYGTTPDAVRGVADRLRTKHGITREVWQEWGRPNWRA